MGSTGGLVDGGRKSGACVGSIRGVALGCCAVLVLSVYQYSIVQRRVSLSTLNFESPAETKPKRQEKTAEVEIVEDTREARTEGHSGRAPSGMAL